MEFGAIRVHLDRFDAPVRNEILACRVPLGAILEGHAVPYRCRPQAFFRPEHDETARQAFALDVPVSLYGRYNIIESGRGEDRAPLAEVVEILPPLEEPTP